MPDNNTLDTLFPDLSLPPTGEQPPESQFPIEQTPLPPSMPIPVPQEPPEPPDNASWWQKLGQKITQAPIVSNVLSAFQGYSSHFVQPIAGFLELGLDDLLGGRLGSEEKHRKLLAAGENPWLAYGKVWDSTDGWGHWVKSLLGEALVDPTTYFGFGLLGRLPGAFGRVLGAADAAYLAATNLPFKAGAAGYKMFAQKMWDWIPSYKYSAMVAKRETVKWVNETVGHVAEREFNKPFTEVTEQEWRGFWQSARGKASLNELAVEQMQDPTLTLRIAKALKSPLLDKEILDTIPPLSAASLAKELGRTILQPNPMETTKEFSSRLAAHEAILKEVRVLTAPNAEIQNIVKSAWQNADVPKSVAAHQIAAALQLPAAAEPQILDMVDRQFAFIQRRLDEWQTMAKDEAFTDISSTVLSNRLSLARVETEMHRAREGWWSGVLNNISRFFDSTRMQRVQDVVDGIMTPFKEASLVSYTYAILNMVEQSARMLDAGMLPRVYKDNAFKSLIGVARAPGAALSGQEVVSFARGANPLTRVMLPNIVIPPSGWFKEVWANADPTAKAWMRAIGYDKNGGFNLTHGLNLSVVANSKVGVDALSNTAYLRMYESALAKNMPDIPAYKALQALLDKAPVTANTPLVRELRQSLAIALATADPNTIRKLKTFVTVENEMNREVRGFIATLDGKLGNIVSQNMQDIQKYAKLGIGNQILGRALNAGEQTIAITPQGRRVVLTVGTDGILRDAKNAVWDFDQSSGHVVKAGSAQAATPTVPTTQPVEPAWLGRVANMDELLPFITRPDMPKGLRAALEAYKNIPDEIGSKVVETSKLEQPVIDLINKPLREARAVRDIANIDEAFDAIPKGLKKWYKDAYADFEQDVENYLNPESPADKIPFADVLEAFNALKVRLHELPVVPSVGGVSKAQAEKAAIAEYEKVVKQYRTATPAVPTAPVPPIGVPLYEVSKARTAVLASMKPLRDRMTAALYTDSTFGPTRTTASFKSFRNEVVKYIDANGPAMSADPAMQQQFLDNMKGNLSIMLDGIPYSNHEAWDAAIQLGRDMDWYSRRKHLEQVGKGLEFENNAQRAVVAELKAHLESTLGISAGQRLDFFDRLEDYIDMLGRGVADINAFRAANAPGRTAAAIDWDVFRATIEQKWSTLLHDSASAAPSALLDVTRREVPQAINTVADLQNLFAIDTLSMPSVMRHTPHFLNADSFVAYVTKMAQKAGSQVDEQRLRQLYDSLRAGLADFPGQKTLAHQVDDALYGMAQRFGDPMHNPSQVNSLHKWIDKIADTAENTLQPGDATAIERARLKSAAEAQEKFRSLFMADEPNYIDATLRTYFPFMMYASRVLPWTIKMAIKRPVVGRTYATFMNNTDLGYIPVGPNMQINPLRGTAGNRMRRLAQRDYPQYYSGLYYEAEDFMNRFGFYLGMPWSLLSTVIGGLEGQQYGAKIEWAGALGVGPFATIPNLIDLYASKVRGVPEATQQSREGVLADRYKAYNRDVMMRQATGMSMRTANNILTSTSPYFTQEQRDKIRTAMANVEARGAVGDIVSALAGFVRMRPDELNQYKDLHRQVLAQLRPEMSVERQQDLWARGQRPQDVLDPPLSPQELRLLDNIRGAVYAGVTKNLAPARQQYVWDMQDAYYFELDGLRSSRYAQQAAIDKQFQSGQLPGDRWRGMSSVIQQQYITARQQLQAHYESQGTPISLEARQAWQAKENMLTPEPHPVKELLDEYFKVTLTTINGVPDWDSFYAMRGDIEESVPPNYQKEFYDELTANMSPVEKMEWEIRRTVLNNYWDIARTVLARSDLATQYQAERFKFGTVEEVARAQESFELQRYNQQVRRERERMVAMNPVLEYWLKYFGYKTAMSASGEALWNAWGLTPPNAPQLDNGTLVAHQLQYLQRIAAERNITAPIQQRNTGNTGM